MRTTLAVGIPLTLYALWLQGVIYLHALMTYATLLFIIFVVIPVVFRHSYTLQRSMLFLPFVPIPREKRFQSPEKHHGLNGTRNFYVTTDEGIKLGVWHVLPTKHIVESQKLTEEQAEEWFEKQLSHGDPVILYMHGNSGSRAGPHRIELYRVLQDLGCHVISFDYRGYGDSSRVPPSEVGVVADGKFMFDWVKQRAKSSSFVVWGHSLGTGVSSHVLSLVASEGNKPHGLILESPFTNLREEIREHPLAQIYRFLPWFDTCFVKPFAKSNLAFESDKHIANIKIPITILHAEDDGVVPFHLGKRLYESALTAHEDSRDFINFASFPSGQGYGHKYICRAPNIRTIVLDFIEKIQYFDQQ